MKKYEMKDSIYLRVQTDLELRSIIARARDIDGMTVRVAAINKSSWLSEYNIVKIIIAYLKIDFDDVFDSDEKVKDVAENSNEKMHVECIGGRWLVNGKRHDKLNDKEKEFLSKFIVYMKLAYKRENSPKRIRKNAKQK